ncbi:MAG: hypothetical protein KC609_26290 [Myxococcales bacterium]|nr:hypothetical protein [Myxococcales bacterium]
MNTKSNTIWKSLALGALVAVFFATAGTASADTDSRSFSAQIYSGYTTSVNGHNGFSVGGKGLVSINPNLRLGGVAYYENMHRTNDHFGGIAFVIDYVAPIKHYVSFFVGSHFGMYTGTMGPAIYAEPGLGLNFTIAKMGIEWRIGSRVPWYVGKNIFKAERDVQVLTTLSFAFQR